MLGTNATIADLIQQLTKTNAKLQRSMARIGTKSDGQGFRRQCAEDRKEAKALCKRIMTLFKENSQNSDKRVMGKLKDQFERELSKFSSVSEQIEKKEREAVITMREDSVSSNQRARGGSSSQHGGYQQMQDDPEFEFLEYDVEDIRKRQEGIRQIEQDVVDVHEMFNDLQNLVQEQQEFVDIIEDNITAAKTKTEAAHGELLQAEKLQKKTRKKTCCIVLILVAVIAVVVLISQAT